MAKRGAPIGNKNAVKHGFYSKALTEAEKMAMEEAKEIEGLDDKLALLWVKLCRLLIDNPDRIDLHLKAVGMIVRLSQTRYALTPPDKENLKDVITSVIREVGIPLGLKNIP